MSNEEKQELQMNDEKRAFIREQIAPKKRSAFKKFMGSVAKTSFLAVIFGLIGSLVFSASGPYFDKFMGKDTEDPVVVLQPTPTPTPTVTPKPTPVPSQGPKIIKEEISAVLDIESLEKVYGLLKEQAAVVNHSIVTVAGVQNGVDWFDNPTESTNVTSGVIIADTDKKIFILASYSRISSVNRIQVTFEGGETVAATLHGSDKDTNLAIVSVETDAMTKDTRKTIEVASLGDSYYAQTGTPVMALGNPNGYMYSMRFGMIAGPPLERYITDSAIELFMTDMEANNNGDGIIVDLEGRILGIITHHFDKQTNSSLCTSISINRVKSLIEKMISESDRAYIGVVASSIPVEYHESLQVERGIYVTEVKNNSPALEAGILVGDIITDVNDTEITTISSFTGAISMVSPKETIKIRIVRTSQAENREKVISLVVGKK